MRALKKWDVKGVAAPAQKFQGLVSMETALLALVWLGLLTRGTNPEQIGSYLYQPAYCMDDFLRGPAEAYMPQPGDIMLATDKNCFWKLTHDLAFAFEPHNSAIFVTRADGSLALLAAGPNDTLLIR